MVGLLFFVNLILHVLFACVLVLLILLMYTFLQYMKCKVTQAEDEVKHFRGKSKN